MVPAGLLLRTRPRLDLRSALRESSDRFAHSRTGTGDGQAKANCALASLLSASKGRNPFAVNNFTYPTVMMMKRIAFGVLLCVACGPARTPEPARSPAFANGPVAVMADAALSPEEAPPPGCRWIESEYMGSVTVTTCDAIAHIQVRFMSYGPGACAVEARSGVPNDAVGVTALPAVFTGWINMPIAHIGPTTRTITNRVICDTGVRSQVRYSAPQ